MTQPRWGRTPGPKESDRSAFLSDAGSSCWGGHGPQALGRDSTSFFLSFCNSVSLANSGGSRKGHKLTRVEGAVACSLCGYNVSETRDSGRNSKDGDPYGRLRLPSAISMGKNACAKTSDMVNFKYLCWKKLASRWSLFVARSNFTYMKTNSCF